MTILWILLATFIVVCALGVVFSRSPITSAISLLVCFIGVAVLYLALGAEFVAAVQVLVYAGGIMVLYIIGIMLTDSEVLRLTRQVHFQAWPVFLLVLVLFLWMGHQLYKSDYAVNPVVPVYAAATADQEEALKHQLVKRAEADQGTNPQRVGRILYGDYLYPFEAASVLLLVAVAGAVFLAKKEI
jgi:NADH-quinone oxidoreductase subunit J